MVKALAQGKLDIRKDAEKLQGAYHEIIETINTAIDNIAEPLRKTGNVMNLMKDSDLAIRMLGEYLRKLQLLRDNINSMIKTVTGLLLQISSSAEISAIASAKISEIAEILASSTKANSAQVDEIAEAIEETSRIISEMQWGLPTLPRLPNSIN